MTALLNDMAVDVSFYRDRMALAIGRLFVPLMDTPDDLFYGPHADSRVVPLVKSGPLARHIQKTGTCYGCRCAPV